MQVVDRLIVAPDQVTVEEHLGDRLETGFDGEGLEAGVIVQRQNEGLVPHGFERFDNPATPDTLR